MNLLQLVFKQMRQRALSTWLTLLSVLLGVALAVSTLVIARESADLFIQTDYGYNVIVGPKASDLQLVLNTVYHLDRSPGSIPWTFYQQLRTDPRYSNLVALAVPYVVGDSVDGLPAIGTLPALFGFDNQTGRPLEGYNDRGELLPGYQSPLTLAGGRADGQPVASDVIGYRKDRKYELSDGRMFHPRRFEAVVGSEVPRLLNKTLGDRFQITHGLPGANQRPDVHQEQWTIVGVLKPTHTANDRALFVPVISYFAIGEHGEGLEAQARIHQGEDVYAATRPAHHAGDDHDDHHGPDGHDREGHDGHHHHHEQAYTLDDNGEIHLDLPPERWQASAVLVKATGGQRYAAATAMQLLYVIRNGNVATAVAPGQVMHDFFQTFLKPSTVLLLLVSALVSVVAAVGILVSIYNSVSARLREIAILRALGATRARVLTIICLEAALIGLIGGVLGLIGGHLVAAAASGYFSAIFGQGISWFVIGSAEWLYLLGVVSIALAAGLVPALKAYRTPVATNLVAVG